MKSNYLWLLRGIMEMALNGFSDHRAQIVNGVCFGGDAVANGSCHIAAVYQVLRDFENDFHIDSVSQNVEWRSLVTRRNPELKGLEKRNRLIACRLFSKEAFGSFALLKRSPFGSGNRCRLLPPVSPVESTSAL